MMFLEISLKLTNNGVVVNWLYMQNNLLSSTVSECFQQHTKSKDYLKEP